MNTEQQTKKQLKDYLHYHPNVYVLFNDEEYKRKTYGEFNAAFITGLFQNEAGAGLVAQLCVDDWEQPLEVMADEFKPLLYPMSSMTKEQAIELAGLSEYPPHFNDVKAERNEYGDWIVSWQGSNQSREVFNSTGELFFCSEQIHWLLRNDFDFFDLISDNLALDKNKQP